MNKVRFRAALAMWLALLFLGALFWAKGRDPFHRLWFTVKTPDHGRAKCIAVLPKMAARPLPVVIYLHGSGGSVLGSGNELRQMAEMGLAAVGMDYSQTNEVEFGAQFTALLNHVRKQKWADTNAVAWVGFSLGANRSLSVALKHTELKPKLLVRLSGGWVPDLERGEYPTFSFQHPTSNQANHSILNSDKSRASPQLSTVLLLHGSQDELFPVADVERVAAALRTNGVPVKVRIIPDQSHDFGPNRLLLFRAVAEHCLTHLRGKEALSDYLSIATWQSRAKPLWLFWIPAFVWIAAWLCCRRAGLAWQTTIAAAPLPSLSPSGGERAAAKPGEGIRGPSRKLTRWEIGLRWVASVLAIFAIGQTALHLGFPRFNVGDKTLAVARKSLVPPKERNDFEFLAANLVLKDLPLRTLLQHVELANYNRELVNWKLDDKIYREYVLSPVIDSSAKEELHWRRSLWESFYPRIRKEVSLEAAAEVVVRHLRERVTIAEGEGFPTGVESIWLAQISTARGFECIYVAALRAVGIPARLSSQGRTEMWTEIGWRPAPRPPIESVVMR